MNPAPGIDLVSPRSFTAEQTADVGSPKSLDVFFFLSYLASCLQLCHFFYFFFLAQDDNPEFASLNYVVVRNKIPRVLAGRLCLDVLSAVQQVHKGVQGGRGFFLISPCPLVCWEEPLWGCQQGCRGGQAVQRRSCEPL